MLIAAIAIAIAALSTSCKSDNYDLNAVQNYTVTFQTDGGSEISSVTTVEGYISEPATPTKEGFTFDGWYTDSLFEIEFDYEAMIICDITLYAKWEAINESDAESESETEPESETETESEEDTEEEEEDDDDSESNPENEPEPEPEPETESETDSDTDAESEQEIETLTVTFDIGDESFIEISEALSIINYGEKATAPTIIISNENLTFDNWYADATYTVVFDFDNIIVQDTTIYGRWLNIAGTVTYYNVEYATEIIEYRNIAAIQIDTIFYGDAVVAPSLAPITTSTTDDEAVEFIGWYEYSNFESGDAYTFPTALTSYNNEIELYAKYSIYTVSKSVKVTFDCNGGEFETDVENPQTVDIDQYATEPDVPTKENTIFIGWYYDGVPFDFDSTPITEDITLVAMWQEVDEGDYIISNEAGLQAFRDAVNSGEAKTANAYLANDITITEANWTPIGSSSLTYFGGVFDGNHHTISGLTINATTQYQGLFGKISDATIKNLTLKNPTISTSYSTASNGAYVGAFVGGVVAGTTSITLENLTLSGGSVSGISTVGGIIGASSIYSASGQIAYITNCTVEEGTTIYRTGDGSYAGAIAGYVSQSGSVIMNCHNKGDLISSGSMGIYNAGIVGSAANTTIVGCSNSGSISSTGNSFGGIVGMAGTNCTIIGCYNTGRISGTSTSYGKNCGGIVGYMNSSSLKLYSCYATGVVTSSATSSPAAGVLLGNLNSSAVSSAVIESCYYIGDTAIGSDSSSGKYSSNITELNSIAELNEVVNAMNSNSTFSAYSYNYQVVDSSTPPIIVAK